METIHVLNTVLGTLIGLNIFVGIINREPHSVLGWILAALEFSRRVFGF